MFAGGLGWTEGPEAKPTWVVRFRLTVPFSMSDFPPSVVLWWVAHSTSHEAGPSCVIFLKKIGVCPT